MGYSFRMTATGYRWDFSLRNHGKIPHGTGQKVLYFSTKPVDTAVTPRTTKPTSAQRDVCITITWQDGDQSISLQDFKECLGVSFALLYSNPTPQSLQATPVGDLIRGGAGFQKIYVRGFEISSPPILNYGYNLLDIDVDRARNSVELRTAARKISKLREHLIEQDSIPSSRFL